MRSPTGTVAPRALVALLAACSPDPPPPPAPPPAPEPPASGAEPEPPVDESSDVFRLAGVVGDTSDAVSPIGPTEVVAIAEGRTALTDLVAPDRGLLHVSWIASGEGEPSAGFERLCGATVGTRAPSILRSLRADLDAAAGRGADVSCTHPDAAFRVDCAVAADARAPAALHLLFDVTAGQPRLEAVVRRTEHGLTRARALESRWYVGERLAHVRTRPCPGR